MLGSFCCFLFFFLILCCALPREDFFVCVSLCAAPCHANSFLFKCVSCLFFLFCVAPCHEWTFFLFVFLYVLHLATQTLFYLNVFLVFFFSYFVLRLATRRQFLFVFLYVLHLATILFCLFLRCTLPRKHFFCFCAAPCHENIFFVFALRLATKRQLLFSISVLQLPCHFFFLLCPANSLIAGSPGLLQLPQGDEVVAGSDLPLHPSIGLGEMQPRDPNPAAPDDRGGDTQGGRKKGTEEERDRHGKDEETNKEMTFPSVHSIWVAMWVLPPIARCAIPQVQSFLKFILLA